MGDARQYPRTADIKSFFLGETRFMLKRVFLGTESEPGLGKPSCIRGSLFLACRSRMLHRMTDGRRALLRKLEHADAFPLVALQALRELRADLDAVEAEAMLRARELGASLEDIAEALEITRQGVSYRLKVLAESGRDDGPAEDEIVDVREPDPRGARSD